MSGESSEAEESVARMIGDSFSGETSSEDDPPELEKEKFEFDPLFQTQIAALAMRDDAFMRSVGHLLDPDYFENIAEATIISIVRKHYEKYRTVPTGSVMPMLIRENIQNSIIRRDIAQLVVEQWKVLRDKKLSDREYVEDKIAEFARHQAVGNAIYKSVDLLQKKKFDRIEETVREAINVGKNVEGKTYEYFSEVTNRSEERYDKLSGKMPPTGITTGILRMDERLYHKGWGRKELASIMGGAKSGKTTALINFAKAASVHGHHVLYVTLEVSARIIAERLDACLTDTMVNDLNMKVKDVEAKVKAISSKAGRLDLVEYPSGSMSPNDLRDYLDRQKSKGIDYDLVVVDYADIMRPNFRTTDPIENMKTIYVDLRAIAFDYNVAMLTATQTNREGHKATVAKMEHVSEDFNKVRTVDLMISINRTADEAKRNEARLYFAASRNQETGFTLIIKQNLGMMKFVEAVIGEE